MNYKKNAGKSVFSMNRRDFINTSSLAAAGIGLSSGFLKPAQAGKSFSTQQKKPFSGIQIAPYSFYDEGMEYCLDLLQEKGAINNLMVSFHAYYGALERPQRLMGDHGVPKADNTKRDLRRCWVDHHEKFYQNTSLRHKGVQKDKHYAGKDLMKDLLPAAKKRGMTVYERLYEPHENGGKYITNFDQVLEIDFKGNKKPLPCMNNPGYKNWLIGTVQDLFTTYPVDGIQFGAERGDPVGRMLYWNYEPSCFCRYCKQRMKDKNIDPGRLRNAYAETYQFLQELRTSSDAPAGGAWHHFLRYLMQYPEMLAWSWEWHRYQNELHQEMYDAIKAINPNAQVGRHIGGAQTMMDMFYRAGAPFEKMAANNDYIKRIVYHEVAGPRVLRKHVKVWGDHVYKGIPHDLILQWYYAQKGHSLLKNPDLEHVKEGMSPHFVYTETKRAVEGVNNKAAIYSGIGIDIPRGQGWGDIIMRSNPESVYKGVINAFKAGAKGVVASREYEEMTIPGLKAYGDAIREV
jgi:hypothetical protein